MAFIKCSGGKKVDLARKVGSTYTGTASINISSYAKKSTSNFIVVPQTGSVSDSKYGVGWAGESTLTASSTFTSSKSISGSTLKITCTLKVVVSYKDTLNVNKMQNLKFTVYYIP